MHERYDHPFLAAAGYAVYANDHRGHGKTAGTLAHAGVAGDDGWNGMVEDTHRLSELARTRHPGLPLFLLGHSMGSLIVQRYIQLWGADLRGAVLSGTFGSLGDDLAGTIAMAEQAVASEGSDAPSAMFGGMFASFNQPFEPGKTGFEWLSRDEDEVRKYVDDPWCGFGFSNRLVADLFKGAQVAWQPQNEAAIPRQLPLLVVSGDQDPAGGNTAAVQLLVDRYRANGMDAVTTKFYSGARHEILNETNRAEVQQDILRWLDSRL